MQSNTVLFKIFFAVFMMADMTALEDNMVGEFRINAEKTVNKIIEDRHLNMSIERKDEIVALTQKNFSRLTIANDGAEISNSNGRVNHSYKFSKIIVASSGNVAIDGVLISDPDERWKNTNCKIYLEIIGPNTLVWRERIMETNNENNRWFYWEK